MSNNDSKEKINIENFNYGSKTERLTSPFSIKACLLKGVKEDDLYEITLEDYIQNNPGSKRIPKELQKERYDNYELNRTQLIETLKEVRNNLKEIDKEKKEKEKEEKEIEEKQKEEENKEEENNKTVKDKNGIIIKNN